MTEGRRVLYLAVACVLVAGLMTVAAYAQGDQPAQPAGADAAAAPVAAGAPGPAAGQPGPARAGGPGGGGRGAGGQGGQAAQMRRMMGMMGQQQTPAIAVAEGYVFVVFAGTLFQFTVDGLQEVGKVQLNVGRPGGGGRGGAGGGGRGAGAGAGG